VTVATWKMKVNDLEKCSTEHCGHARVDNGVLASGKVNIGTMGHTTILGRSMEMMMAMVPYFYIASRSVL